MDHHHHQNHHNTTTGTTTTTTTSRTEAERLLGISEKLLHSRDLSGSREFALLAQETEPLLEGSDLILAITDVLLASEKRVINNRHYDWYSILQTQPRSDPDLIKKNYRRLAFLLHPDKNKYPYADSAFKLVADAWATLADASKKNSYDNELGVFSKVNLQPHAPQQKQTPRRSARSEHVAASGGVNKSASFWTACPYCYLLYEYSSVYEDCCLRCQNCERAFHASSIPSLPPMVPGKEAYYCCWGFFPLGFSIAKDKDINFDNNNENDDVPPNVNNVNGGNNNTNDGVGNNSGFPNWMPGVFGSGPRVGAGVNMNVPSGGGTGTGTDGGDSGVFGNNTNRSRGGGNVPVMFNFAQPSIPVPGQKKRGRPRKNPI